jgi:hypothetical protein
MFYFYCVEMKGITKLHHFSRKVVDDEGTEE